MARTKRRTGSKGGRTLKRKARSVKRSIRHSAGKVMRRTKSGKGRRRGRREKSMERLIEIITPGRES